MFPFNQNILSTIINLIIRTKSMDSVDCRPDLLYRITHLVVCYNSETMLELLQFVEAHMLVLYISSNSVCILYMNIFHQSHRCSLFLFQNHLGLHPASNTSLFVLDQFQNIPIWHIIFFYIT